MEAEQALEQIVLDLQEMKVIDSKFEAVNDRLDQLTEIILRIEERQNMTLFDRIKNQVLKWTEGIRGLFKNGVSKDDTD